MSSRLKLALGGVLAVLAIGGLGPVLLRGLLAHWEDNSILRGREVAEAEGCFGCHLPPTSAEIPNPGSRWGTVPRFRGGNALMYGETRAEVEETIRFGTPKPGAVVAAESEEGDNAPAEEPQRILMPAYGEHLSDAALWDLLDYVTAEEGVELPGGADVQAGRELARKQGCTSCHGVEGAGGLANPGSLGGFVPGFLGRNFEHLVHDRDEFEEWVRGGSLERLAKNPLLAYLWRSQRLSMPAYDTLTDQEIDQLWTWVQTTRQWSSR